MGKSCELLFVDDGSTDNTLKILQELKAEDPDIRIIQFTRNFGQQAAVLAGFRLSRGEIVVQIDADLQNPPEEIPKLLDALTPEYDLATTVNKKRRDDIWRVVGSKALFWLGKVFLGKAVRLNLSSFRAMRRSVIEKIDACSDRSRYMAVLVSWMGAPTVEVEVAHDSRLRGKTKYNTLTLVKLAWDMVTGYSNAPLRLVTYLGFVGATLGFTLVVFLLYQRFVAGILVEGFILLSAIFAFLAGVQLLSIGLLGEYIGRIFLQVQSRPDYVIEKEID